MWSVNQGLGGWPAVGEAKRHSLPRRDLRHPPGRSGIVLPLRGWIDILHRDRQAGRAVSSWLRQIDGLTVHMLDLQPVT